MTEAKLYLYFCSGLTRFIIEHSITEECQTMLLNGMMLKGSEKL